MHVIAPTGDPEESNCLHEKYLEATHRPQGYLLLDLAPDTDVGLCFRTNIIPPEIPVVFNLTDNETYKIETSHATSS